jgi:hypothetical protein
MIMDIKEIIEDAREAGFLICNREYFGGADELLKFAELTLKRASLSANEQDAITYDKNKIRANVINKINSSTNVMQVIDETMRQFDKAIANKKCGV